MTASPEIPDLAPSPAPAPKPPKLKAIKGKGKQTPALKPLYVHRATYINDPVLIDEDNFKRYFDLIHSHITQTQAKIDWHNEQVYNNPERKVLVDEVLQRVATARENGSYYKNWLADKFQKELDKIDKAFGGFTPAYTYDYAINYLIKNDKSFPFNYRQRLIVRQLALGIDISPEVLDQFKIVFYGLSSKVKRLPREYRQPTNPTDFVLIDTANWQQYPTMQALFDNLPLKIPMARDKSEPTNTWHSKQDIRAFSHFTPNIKGKYTHEVIFDLDPQDGQDNFTAWQTAGLPPPNKIICNPQKENSCQYLYTLASPVRPLSNPQGQKWLESIYACMAVKLNADVHFARMRSKNPFSPDHDVYVSGAEPYTLKQLSDECNLASYKPFSAPLTLPSTNTPSRAIKATSKRLGANNDPKFNDKLAPDHDHHKDGRNEATFDNVRHDGYAHAYLVPDELLGYVFNACKAYQSNFDTPLDDVELGYIAKSITNYCIEKFGMGTGTRNPKYTRKDSDRPEFVQKSRAKFIPTTAKQKQFSIHQTNRVNKRWVGYKDKQAQAIAMLKDGFKQVDICRELGISKMTLSRWKKFNEII